MQKAGNLYVPDGDWYFGPYFSQYGDVFEEINLLTGLRFVKQFRGAVDGGAHVGSWTRALAERFANVVAFEPQADNFECLKANTSHLLNVKALRMALGDESATGSLDPGNNSGCWHVGLGDDFPVRKLDDEVCGPVDFLKLDVEGYEWYALKGAEATVAEWHPVIQIEEKKLPHSYDCPTARSLLVSWGYKEVARMGRDVVFTWA